VRKDFIKSDVGLNSTMIPMEKLDEIVKNNINGIVKNSTELLNFAIILDQKIKVDKLKTEDVFKLKDINDQIICNLYYKNTIFVFMFFIK